MWLVFILYASFASIFILEKVCLQYTEPLFLLGFRMVIAAILMLLFYFLRNRERWRPTAKHIGLLFCLGFFNIYLTNSLELWALQRMAAFKICFIYSLSPFMAALLSYALFSEALSKWKWAGLLVGFLGLLPLLIEKEGGDATIAPFLSLPEVVMMGAMVCSVYGWILLKQLVDTARCPLLLANGASMLIGGTLSLTHSRAMESWDPFPIVEFANFFFYAFLILAISNLFCYNLYAYLLKRFSPTFMSLAGFTTLPFTAILGRVFLEEPVTLAFYPAALTIFAGLYLFSKAERLHPAQAIGE